MLLPIINAAARPATPPRTGAPYVLMRHAACTPLALSSVQSSVGTGHPPTPDRAPRGRGARGGALAWSCAGDGELKEATVISRSRGVFSEISALGFH